MDESKTIITVVSSLCGLIVLAAVIAVTVYCCCIPRKKQKSRSRSDPLPNGGQANGHFQLPKVGSSGLWMTKPVMQADGPSNAYLARNPTKMRPYNDPMMLRKGMSSPDTYNNPGYVFQGNLRMYHSQQFPMSLERPGGYYNNGILYTNYESPGFAHTNGIVHRDPGSYPATDYLSSDENEYFRRGPSASANLSGSEPFNWEREGRDSVAVAEVHKRPSRNSHSRGENRNGSSPSGDVSDGGRQTGDDGNRNSDKWARKTTSKPDPYYYSGKINHGFNPGRETPTVAPKPQNYHKRVADKDHSQDTADSPGSKLRVAANTSLPNVSGNVSLVHREGRIAESDTTDMEHAGKKITAQAFEFLDTYLSDDEVEQPQD